MEYLLIILAFLLVSILIKQKFKIKIYKSRKQTIIITLVFFVIGILADTFAVWRGYWTFHEPFVFGLRIWLLPLEEYILFLVAPFFGITVYRLIQKKFK